MAGLPAASSETALAHRVSGSLDGMTEQGLIGRSSSCCPEKCRSGLETFPKVLALHFVAVSHALNIPQGTRYRRMSSDCLSVAVCFCGCTLIRYLVMSCSPQNPSPTSPLSPSWPMFSAPSSPMPTSSTSSDSSPIRSVAEFALLFVAFAIFCLIYSVSPRFTFLFSLHPAQTPPMQLSAFSKRGAFKRLLPQGRPFESSL